MSDPTPSRVERNEIDFFASYYANQAYHPIGSRLKSQRELRSILRAARGKPLGRVLSIGCGDGEFERMLAGSAQHVTGLDLSPEAIEIATREVERHGVRNLDFVCKSFSDLAWDRPFDTIVCLAFLHHVPEPDLPALLAQAHAHLTPGGFFYSQDPNVNGVLRKVGRLVLGAHYDDYHSPDERELDPEPLRQALLAAGFASAEIVPIDLTLIPAMYVLAKRPGWPLYACPVIDRIWCATPLGRWASGFAAVARRAA